MRVFIPWAKEKKPNGINLSTMKELKICMEVWYILIAVCALSQQWFSNLPRKRRETIKKRNEEGKKENKREA